MSIRNLYPSIKPSLLLDFVNSKGIDPRITAARASTALAYDGKTVAKAEENLLLQSEDFTNTVWDVSSNVSRTGNTAVAPNGTTTADTITANAGTAFIPRAIQSYSTSLQVTASVFAKAGTHNFLQLATNAAGSGFVTFDLNAGTLSATTATGTISSVGSGWYRCTATFVAASIANVQFGLAASASATRNEAWNPVGTESVFLWGAQLEQRSSVTAYTPTTTQPITNYIPVLQTYANNVLRLDHNPVTGESLGFLVEESRTNLLLRSVEFDDAAWTKSNSSITANTIVAPDGTLTGDKLVENTSNAAHTITSGNISATAQAYTLSVFLKRGERKFAQLFGRRDTTNYNGVQVDLDTGQLSAPTRPGTTNNSASTTVQPVGNGWWRVAMTFTYTTTGNTVCFISTSNDLQEYTYTGDGTSGIFIWGAQLEVGSFPTSYIRTEASQVTRAADAASMTGANFSSWYRQDEGTLFAEFAYSSETPTTFSNIYEISDNTSNNRIFSRRPNFSGIESQVINASATQVAFSTAFLQAGKNILTYKTDDIAYVQNAGTVSTDTSAAVPVTTQIGIGWNGRTGGQMSGHIRRIAYYPKRLTNAQLQALTQI